MPKPPNIPSSFDEDWDDEIEENLALKYAEQEEYNKMQGNEEEPILRRPTFPIVHKPCLPLLNRPVNILQKSGQLRRPNLPIETANVDFSTLSTKTSKPSNRDC